MPIVHDRRLTYMWEWSGFIKLKTPEYSLAERDFRSLNPTDGLNYPLIWRLHDTEQCCITHVHTKMCQSTYKPLAVCTCPFLDTSQLVCVGQLIVVGSLIEHMVDITEVLVQYHSPQHWQLPIDTLGPWWYWCIICPPQCRVMPSPHVCTQ